MEPDKIVIVKRRTPLEELLVRHSTAPQAKFYLESAGHSYTSYQQAHDAYVEGLQQTLSAIPNGLRMQIVDKSNLANFQFGNKDLVVVVGDDGLLVNVAKYIGSQPVIAVNPDEKRFDGVLASCNSDSFYRVFRNVLEDKVDMQLLTMAEATLDDGQVMRSLNDLFLGRRTHVSAKYELEYKGNKERLSSSGMIISTGTGSTGWMTSVIAGAMNLFDSQPKPKEAVPFVRDADYLLFAVREPFPSKLTGTKITYGRITRTNPLIVRSNMPSDGVIFGDGIENDYLEFYSGRTATISLAENKVCLVRAQK